MCSNSQGYYGENNLDGHKSPYEPRKPVLPKPPAIRSNNSSPYDASGRPKND